ncbi:MAG: hypothetical protein J5802_14985 [Butyrivibrio sp.]|nr:hypothetical protein [Butyrivibrio sp.]
MRQKKEIEMVANVIAIFCTVLMVGALIWVAISEAKTPKDTEEKDEDNDDKIL